MRSAKALDPPAGIRRPDSYCQRRRLARVRRPFSLGLRLLSKLASIEHRAGQVRVQVQQYVPLAADVVKPGLPDRVVGLEAVNAPRNLSQRVVVLVVVVVGPPDAREEAGVDALDNGPRGPSARTRRTTTTRGWFRRNGGREVETATRSPTEDRSRPKPEPKTPTVAEAGRMGLRRC
jgi:hypothetical protein